MCVAGGVSLDDGLKLIAARGRLMQALPAGGVMTSVMADEDARPGGDRRLGRNGRHCRDQRARQVVISGAGTAVAEISARLTANGIKTKALTVSHAFHSPLMKPMLAEYERVVREIRFSPPRVPFVSCVDGVIVSDEMTRPDYWLRQVMEPVRFAAGMRTLEAEGVGACIEIGPHPVLLGMGRQCVSDDAKIEWLPSLRRDADDWRTLLASVARLYERGSRDRLESIRRAVPAAARVGAGLRVLAEAALVARRAAVQKQSTQRVTEKPTVRSAMDRAQFYELTWRLDNQPRSEVVQPESVHWVIFADDGGVGTELAGLLTDQVCRCDCCPSRH